MRRVSCRAPDTVCLCSKIGRLRVEDVRHEDLRIAIIQREPRALHLHHDAVPLLEAIRLRRNMHRVLEHPIGRDRLRMVECGPIAAAHDFSRDHQLVTAHSPVALGGVRVDIDEFDHPIGVAARRRREQPRAQIAGDHEVFLQRLRAPHENIRPSFDEPLIHRLPLIPLRSARVRHLDGSRPVGHRMGRIGNERIGGRAGDGRLVERKPPVCVEVEVLCGRCARRPGVEPAPAIRSAFEHERLGKIERSAILEIEREEWRLHLSPEPDAGRVAELHAREARARTVPTTVIPGTHDDTIAVRPGDGVESLERRIGRRRAEDVFLIVPATHGEHRHRRRVNPLFGGARLPVLVVARVRDEPVPRRPRAAEQLRHPGKLTHAPIPVVHVGHADIELADFHAIRVFDAVALPERALMEEVVAHPGVRHGRLRRDGTHGGVT